ncbi:MAG: DNA primase, partial [Candidatus Omnitrophica bacterium]|nr:DNA primase [Candidatus Omnitrophota bacterium]
ALHFLMQYERLTFREAIEILAKRVGIDIPVYKDNTSSSLITQIYKVNELACLFYIQRLKENKEIINYLLKRGIKWETLQEFKIGYAPSDPEPLMNYLREKSFSLSLLEKAGLIVTKDNGGYCDRFRNRIIFPIFDIKSRVIGFGGRILPSEENKFAKYINSPETEVYIKGRNLYGLNFSKEAIRDLDSVVIVEGYLDFIIPYQEGIRNIVASLGTAFTPEQARLLKRYTQNIIVVFDGDEAGELAVLRSLDTFIENELNVRVVILPTGFDPDTFVRKFGKEKFKELMVNAQSFFDYKLETLRKRFNFSQPEEKAMATAEMLISIKKIKNAILRAEYIKRLSEKIGVSEQFIREELNKIKEEPSYNLLSEVHKEQFLNIPAVEKLFLRLVLEGEEFIINAKDKISPSDFQDERISKIVSVIFELLEDGKLPEHQRLINYFEEPVLSQIVCQTLFT